MNSEAAILESERRFNPYVHTGAIDDDALGAHALSQHARAHEWKVRCQVPLKELAERNGATIDGMRYPTREALEAARAFVAIARNIDAPNSIVPSGDGGIVFEIDRENDELMEIEIRENGRVDLRLFDGSSLIFDSILLSRLPI